MNLEELKARAKAATAGPWELQDSCSWRRIGTLGHNGNVLCPTVHPYDNHPDLTAGRGEDAYANLRYIASADPTTILSLIEEIERLREALAASEDERRKWIDAARSALGEG